jgi:hypothetical protein
MSRRSLMRASNPHQAPPVAIATRRDLLGTMGALLLLSAAEADPAKAAELDGNLLDACAEFSQADRLMGASFRDAAISHEAGVALTSHRDGLLAIIAGLPARLPRGCKRKRRRHGRAMDTDLPEMLVDTFQDCAQPWHTLLDALCRDMTGRAGA